MGGVGWMGWVGGVGGVVEPTSLSLPTRVEVMLGCDNDEIHFGHFQPSKMDLSQILQWQSILIFPVTFSMFQFLLLLCGNSFYVT